MIPRFDQNHLVLIFVAAALSVLSINYSMEAEDLGEEVVALEVNVARASVRTAAAELETERTLARLDQGAEDLASCLEHVGPYLNSALIEVEERHQLSTSAERVCTADGRQVKSYTCTLEEAETDQIIFRGGNAVADTDGLQFCDACNMGPVISGDAKSAYLRATSGTPYVRCVCGY